MAYFLKISKLKKDSYLQIYESFHDKSKKQARNKCVKSIGYLNDLITNDIKDPITYYKDIVNKMNLERKESFEIKISSSPVTFNLGFFLIKSVLDDLKVTNTIEIFSSTKQFQFNISDLIYQLIFAQIVAPSSKKKYVDEIFPSLYNSKSFSKDQVYDGLKFIGENYKRFIEVFNHQFDSKYKRNLKKLFFDCTNYYFEIDLPKDDKQKGPSKEHRPDPIIGQALLLDAEQMPLCMEMFPGNESEKPYIRKLIEDMKTRYNVNGRTIQIADKGLNCARNIYAATKESNDGYIFSKSIHGSNLSSQEKQWVPLMDDYKNKWTYIKDKDGKLLYRIKEDIDEYEYHFINEDGENIKFKVKEKRVVSYNPSLAEKQKLQIKKQIEKAKTLNSIKSLEKEEYGDSVKYVVFEAVDKNKKKVKIDPILNEEKIKEDLDLAGYNLIVTSEYKQTAKEIYRAYHGLWRIEQSFRILKSTLESRPVYLQCRETIYGHFLICYLSLFILRILEIKYFKEELTADQIVDYIRKFKITEGPDNIFINNSLDNDTLKTVKRITSLSKIDNMYLSKTNIEKILKFEI